MMHTRDEYLEVHETPEELMGEDPVECIHCGDLYRPDSKQLTPDENGEPVCLTCVAEIEGGN